jgi:beta-galactosidase
MELMKTSNIEHSTLNFQFTALPRIRRWMLNVGCWMFAILSLCLVSSIAAAEVHTVTIAPLRPPSSEGFQMGHARNPSGETITLDNQSLRLNGKPWTPVMGEFHYSRYPENEWREELLKMKAGGIDIVATYVFWIHHEEIEGEFDWTGRRHLRSFIETARDVGLKAIVRCGPWCHGEVRNGGLPDWILKKGWQTRSDDTNYLAKTKIFYNEIAEQLRGLLWKEGGPVIGIQLDNEYGGPASHLLSLKRIAREVGLDVPLYTRTGWPALRTAMPFGEIVPLYGVYAEGFWDRELTPMPGRYWSGFHFSMLRTDSNIANELLGRRNAVDSPDVARYPYLTCEIGGGMINSYHRRILVDPADIESTTLIKIGSGSTSPGYYMYHGGVNPEGKLTTLMESQATEYWNDVPVKNYDFQGPLGEYGQIRPHYHLLRRLHMFLHEWGPTLANMPPAMPERRPEGRDDETTLRWSARSDGGSGFVFVNNYERLKVLPAKKEVQFSIKQPSDIVVFPESPVTIPSNARFIWPFNLDLGHGVQLKWAAAQPVTAIDDGNTRTIFFTETPGVPAQFAFDSAAKIKADSGKISRQNNQVTVSGIEPGLNAAIRISGNRGTTRIVLLDHESSLSLWKGDVNGQERVFLTRAGLVMDGNTIRLATTNHADLNVAVFPPLKSLKHGGKSLSSKRDGVFSRFTARVPRVETISARIEAVQPAGEPRVIPMAKTSTPVAAAPEDPDFEKAAVWRVHLPEKLNANTDSILRFDYTGDVARILLNGKLVTDDFYNGNMWDMGLRRHSPQVLEADLRVQILPLQKHAPIYMHTSARPDFGNQKSIAGLHRVEVIPQYRVELQAN